ncbi:MAG: transposase [Gaiellaceae bacterium]
MGHTPRLTVAGTYHLMTRSIAEERIFRATADYIDFVTILARADWTCHAVCVMPTHYHVLASVEDGILDKLMHRLNLAYARAFNRRHARRGHVFDVPYRSVFVESNSHVLWLARYIAQNPSRPREWQWSSFVSDFSFVDATLLENAFGGRERMLDFALAP